jgi:IclR family KDG regulon transcriptional repressor
LNKRLLIVPSQFKRVPAVDKCFAILELLARSNEPLGISDISGKLGFNKSTVFNIGRTLIDLKVLENQRDGKFGFGTRFYILSNMAGQRSTLIQSTHPYLEKINERTKLSAFLGLRSDNSSILVDKVDSAYRIKLSSEIGLQMPALAGAGIKAMLSQLSDEEIDEILARTELKKYTPHSIVDKVGYKEEILEVRKQGIAFDREEYIEGMVAFAIPVKANARDSQAAIWAVGLTRQVPSSSIPELTHLLKGISEEINYRLL